MQYFNPKFRPNGNDQKLVIYYATRKEMIRCLYQFNQIKSFIFLELMRSLYFLNNSFIKKLIMSLRY